MDDVKNNYYVQPAENVQFTKSELKRMGISFIDNLSKIEEGLINLGIESLDPDGELVDYGYTLAHIGSFREESWVIYSTSLNFEYVSDVWHKNNFYVISKKTKDEDVIVFDKVHLRKDSIKEDVTYYIDLDLNRVSGQHEVYPNYLH